MRNFCHQLKQRVVSSAHFPYLVEHLTDVQFCIHYACRENLLFKVNDLHPVVTDIDPTIVDNKHIFFWTIRTICINANKHQQM